MTCVSVLCWSAKRCQRQISFAVPADDGLESAPFSSSQSTILSLKSQQVCFVANLAARKIRGVTSQGMLLSVEDAKDGTISLLTTSKESKFCGSRIS